MHCSGSCYVIALILLDRLKTANPIYTLTSRNIHKLVFTAILIASKTVDDLSFSQEYYAKVAGLKPKELS